MIISATFFMILCTDKLLEVVNFGHDQEIALGELFSEFATILFGEVLAKIGFQLFPARVLFDHRVPFNSVKALGQSLIVIK